MARIRALLLDLDNTLVDFMKMKQTAVHAAIEAMVDAGLEMSPTDAGRRIWAIYDEEGFISLSKRKAEKIEAWKKVMEAVHEGDVVSGVVTRKIKGGLLVDISGILIRILSSKSRRLNRYLGP